MPNSFPLFFVNGQPCNTVSVMDRGFNYGDGCFETMRAEQGVIPLWSFHQQRLQRSLQLLGIDLDLSELQLAVDSALNQLPWGKKLVRVTIKLLVTRGDGGRGYLPPEKGRPNIIVGVYEFSSSLLQQRINGVGLCLCRGQIGESPLLAGLKHLNRLEQVLLRQECDRRGFTDGLVSNSQNFIIEAVSSNVFFLIEQQLCTPMLENHGVAGVMRDYIMRELAPSIGMTVHQGYYKEKDLIAVTEVFLCNALMGITPVTSIDTLTFDVGPRTRQLQQQLQLLWGK